jgi:predicted lipoprotein
MWHFSRAQHFTVSWASSDGGQQTQLSPPLASPRDRQVRDLAAPALHVSPHGLISLPLPCMFHRMD